MLTAADLQGFTEGYNPLLAGSQALSKYWTLNRELAPADAPEPEPYVLLIVRPSGSFAYYAARRLLSRLKTPSGYELVEENWKLAPPKADPQATAVCREAIEDVLAQRAQVVESVISQRRLNNRGLRFRREFEGGFVAEDEGERLTPRPVDPFEDRGFGHARRGAAGGSPDRPATRGGDSRVNGQRGTGQAPGSTRTYGRRGIAGTAGVPENSAVPGTNGTGNGTWHTARGSGAAHSRDGVGDNHANPQGTKLQGRGNGFEASGDETFSEGSGDGSSEFPLVSEGATSDDESRGVNKSTNSGNAHEGPLVGESDGRIGSGQESQYPGAMEPGTGSTADSPDNPNGSMSQAATSRSGSANATTGTANQSGSSGSSEACESCQNPGSTAQSSPQFPQSLLNASRGKRQFNTSRPEDVRWGLSPRHAGIGFERDVPVHLYANWIMVGEQSPIPVGRGESRDELVKYVLGSIDNHARSWGDPPRDFYWVPTLRYVVSPGGNQYLERIRGSLGRWGLKSSVTYTLETDQSSSSSATRRSTTSRRRR